jgi:hypothetical protein
MKRQRTVAKTLLVALLMVCVTTFALHPKQVQAQTPVIDLGVIAQLFTSTSLLTAANVKEYVLDPLAWMAAQAMVRSISQSTINWINSGFQGSPAYVTDLDGFLTDIADRTIGNFISGTGLRFLCSPFQLQIRIALARHFGKFEDRTMCRLTGIVSNIESFINGNFAAGGWAGWFQLVTVDNQYNRFLDATVQISTQIYGQQNQALAQLSWGRGFFGWQRCEDVQGTKKCTTVTPGAAIENNLSKVLDLPLDKLGVADEINEIISALVMQLLGQVFGGGGGLRGASSYGGYSQASGFSDPFFDQPLSAGQCDPYDASYVYDKFLATNGAYAKLSQAEGLVMQTLTSIINLELPGTAANPLDALDEAVDSLISTSPYNDLISSIDRAVTRERAYQVIDEALDDLLGLANSNVEPALSALSDNLRNDILDLQVLYGEYDCTTEATFNESSPGSGDTLKDGIAFYISQESRYRQTVSTSLARVNQSASFAEGITNCPAVDDLLPQLDPYFDELEDKLARADENLSILIELEDQRKTALSQDEIANILFELDALGQSGDLHETLPEIQAEENRRTQIESAMNNFDGQVSFQNDICNPPEATLPGEQNNGGGSQ